MIVHLRRTFAAAGSLTTVVVLVGACGLSERPPASDPNLPQAAAASVHVQLADVPGLGSVLADGTGHVLYMFPPDAGGRVTCTGPWAGTWPPLAVIGTGHTSAGAGVNTQLLGTLSDPNTGGRIVTYSGYPLYRYAGDVDPGTAHGQALFLNGGPWYAVDANGQPLTNDSGTPG